MNGAGAPLADAAWPPEHARDALAALARKAGLTRDELPFASPVPFRSYDAARVLDTAASQLDLELEPETLPFAKALEVTQGPRLVFLPDGYLLAVLPSRGRQARLLAPGGAVMRLPRLDLERALREPLYGDAFRRAQASAHEVLTHANVTGERYARSLERLLAEQLKQATAAPTFSVRSPPRVAAGKAMRQLGVPWLLAGMFAIQAVSWPVYIAAFALLGQVALQGAPSPYWGFWFGAALVVSTALESLGRWWQRRATVSIGAWLKRRLLDGALRLDTEQLHREGVGGLLSRVLESSNLETNALTGLFALILVSVELVYTLVVLGLGGGGIRHMLLALPFLFVVVLAGYKFVKHRERWADARLAATGETIEGMLGHRTNLVQGRPDDQEGRADAQLAAYTSRSLGMDRWWIRLTAVAPHVWLAYGLMTLALTAHGGTVTSFAAGMGGVLLGYQAFWHVNLAARHLADALVAWRQVRPLYYASGKRTEPGTGVIPDATDGRILGVRDVSYVHPERVKPALRGVDLELAEGEHLLVTGPSGGGKSTLVSLLSGARLPSQGLVLLHGLDRWTVGETAWRRQVALVPQFHENHILSGPFLYNLLLGREWPPTEADIDEAAGLCHDLGLGPLVERMPGGMWQFVGETGWQLSHGEKSRVYLARALLQRAEVVALDESFGALDPVTLAQALRVTRERVKTLVVVAHP